MDNTDYLLARIGQLAIEHVIAWDIYKETVEEEFALGVAGKAVVTQIERIWRDVCTTRIRLNSEVHRYLKHINNS